MTPKGTKAGKARSDPKPIGAIRPIGGNIVLNNLREMSVGCHIWRKVDDRYVSR